MPKWLKYVISAGTGFLVPFAGAKSNGLSYGSSAIVGALGVLTALGNLQATSPADHAALGITK